MKKSILLMLLVGLSSLTIAQHQIWYDDFEDASKPSSGTRTPDDDSGVDNLIPGGGDDAYFMRAVNSNLDLTTLSDGNYSNMSGTYFWAGEDHPDVDPQHRHVLSIVWSGIDISGKGDLTFKGLFGAHANPGEFDNTKFGNSNTDFIIVDYAIDGGSYMPLISFYSKSLSAKQFYEDTNNDSLGDGTMLTKKFMEFSKSISGTGSTMTLRMRAHSDDVYNEEWAIDNFRLFACSSPVISKQPSNDTSCANSSAQFSVTATGANTYQWQVNTGSGFTNISDATPYSGTSTATLSLASVTTAMTDYQYRCILANGSCSDTSNTAKLTVSKVTATAAGQTNVSCNGGQDGAALASVTGGISPYTYSWSPSVGSTISAATNLTAGTYTFTATDHNGCSGQTTFTITEPSALKASIASQTNIACNGGTDGAAMAMATGGTSPYTYSWSPSGGSAASATGLTAGTYTVTVTDNNRCKNKASVTITEPTALKASIASQTNVTCNGGADGAATAMAKGGTSPYIYSWSPSGGSAASATGLTAGTYTATVTDNNGCTDQASATITEPSLIQSSTIVDTCGSYTWSDGKTYTQSGTYTQTLTASSGCDSIATLDLTIYQVIPVTITSLNTQTLEANGNISTYQWIDCSTNLPIKGETSADFTFSKSGLYAVIGTSSDGCVDTSACFDTGVLAGIIQGMNTTSLITLSPNPTSNKVKIEFPGSEADVFIYNSNGNLIFSAPKTPTGSQLSLESVETGMYLLRIVGTRGVWHKQLIKR